MTKEKQLGLYVKELLKWNKKVNLIGRKSESGVWREHVEDSLALLPYLEKDPSDLVADIGSGGGLPAIPLSIYLPYKHFILTDVVAKKLGFLRWVIAKLQLNAEAADLNKDFIIEKPCVITSRAFSELKNIIAWQQKHAPSGQRFYLLKGTTDNTRKECLQASVDSYTLVERERGTLLIIPKSEEK